MKPEPIDEELMLRMQARLGHQREQIARYRGDNAIAYQRDRAGAMVGINSAPLPPFLDYSWREEALCRGPEHDTSMFFPGRGDTDSLRAARAICAECSVTDPCVEFALVTGAEGIWGGTSEKQRRAMRRKLGRALGETSAPGSR